MRAEKIREMKEKGTLLPGKAYDDCLLNEVLKASRTSFDNIGKRDIEVALEESLAEYEKQHQTTARPGDALLEQTLKASMDQFQQVILASFFYLNKLITNLLMKQMDEETIIQAAIDESKKMIDVTFTSL